MGVTGTLDQTRFSVCILFLFSILCLSPCSTAEQDSLPPLEGSGPALGPTTAPTAAQQQRVPIHKPFTQSRLPPDLPMHPAPRHITEEELRVLEGCLHRWRSEVENDTRGRYTCLPFEAVYACLLQHDLIVHHFLYNIAKVNIRLALIHFI